MMSDDETTTTKSYQTVGSTSLPVLLLAMRERVELGITTPKADDDN